MMKKFFRELTLSKKLIFSFLALAIIPVVTVSLFVINTMYNEQISQVNEHNIYTARLKSNAIENALLNQKNLMLVLADSLAVQSGNIEAMEAELRAAKKNSPLVANMFICDINGQQIARDSGKYVNVLDRTYIKEVMFQGKPFSFSEAVLSKVTDKIMIIAAVPIKNSENQIVGAIGSTFNLDTLENMLNDGINQLPDRKEIIYLADIKGNVMIHPDNQYTDTLTCWQDLPPVKEALNNNLVALRYTNTNGVDCMGAAAPLNVLNWALVLENDRNEVMSVLYTAISRVVIISSILIILVFLFAKYLANSFVRPLKELEEKTSLMAGGDLTLQIYNTNNDEIGHVAAAFNNMIRQLNDVMRKISTAAEQVASGSKNISDSGNMLAKGAASQASSVEELSSSISEITVQTSNNAENAIQANQLAINTNKMAESGTQRMEKMLQAMTDINTSSANIAKIIKVIDEIAFQTNILALNAAVEAARAGQHGKGFAVVAEEVRNLAARSAKAAKETTDIIEHSLATVTAGTELAQDTSNALHSIRAEIEEVTSLVGEIATASQKQNTALQMLNEGVLQVSKIVQTNSSTAEESAAASVELNAQADLLHDAIQGFKL